MPIFLSNTLTGKKEEFKPVKVGHVGMYHCGPTVYDFVHIGNLRSWVTADLLRRTLEYGGYEVKQIMNITDIGHLSGNGDEGEDKMTKGLKREGRPLTIEAMKEMADFYAERFKEDLEKINILTPHEFPKASEHIKEDIELIETLESKGFAYKTSDGVYFDTSRDKDYGKLGGSVSDKEEYSRIGENPEKKNPRDFALWKLNPTLGFESPWGKGFPGWHIECSAMAKKYLGEHFDIHTGGIDLAPIHHNNEIAQSENACDCQFVNYWVHNAFVNIGSDKMAKSEGTGLQLRTLAEKGFSALAYRYWLLGGHYRTPMTFSFEALEGAQNAFVKMQHAVRGLGESVDEVNAAYIDKFTEYVNDDFNTAKSLALTWDMLKDPTLSAPDKKATVLEFDKVLGLGLADVSKEDTVVPAGVVAIAEERETARKNKDWKKADELRDKISKLGFEIKDTDVGFKLIKK